MRLVNLLVKELALRDGDDHAFFAQFNKIDAIRNVVIAYVNGIPVGCRAIKVYEQGIGEVKKCLCDLNFAARKLRAEY